MTFRHITSRSSLCVVLGGVLLASAHCGKIEPPASAEAPPDQKGASVSSQPAQAQQQAPLPETDVPSGIRLLAARANADDPLQWIPVADATAQSEIPTTLVICIHGLDEPGGIFDEVAPVLQDAGHPVARFDYPNDQAIADSSALFGAALRDLSSRGVTSASIIAHSMGGLVMRDVLTRNPTDASAPAWYRGTATGHAGLPDITRFIMVAVPNHGSYLAHVEGIGELREQVQRFFEADKDNPTWPGRFKDDGRGEAAEDLLPNSAFLADLNARPLPTGVRMTNIIGRMAPEETSKWIGSIKGSFVERLIGEHNTDRTAEAMNEVVGDIGDGIVTAESARLEGVTDEVEVSGNHRTILNRWVVSEWIEKMTKEKKAAPAIQVIVERLEAKG